MPDYPFNSVCNSRNSCSGAKGVLSIMDAKLNMLVCGNIQHQSWRRKSSSVKVNCEWQKKNALPRPSSICCRFITTCQVVIFPYKQVESTLQSQENNIHLLSFVRWCPSYVRSISKGSELIMCHHGKQNSMFLLSITCHATRMPAHNRKWISLAHDPHYATSISPVISSQHLPGSNYLCHSGLHCVGTCSTPVVWISSLPHC